MPIQYTIENFWATRLNSAEEVSPVGVAGWFKVRKGLETFIEAPLKLSADLRDEQHPSDPATDSVILISAPGAVGKSTLARQLSSATGAIYVDLSRADPVGGNTLSGGLVRAGVYTAWQNEEIAVLIDGLDEARIRVTQEAFEAFLKDIAEISKGRRIPTLVFGRTGAVIDAWLNMSDVSTVSVLEIGYYGSEAALDFADAHLRDQKPNDPFHAAARSALSLLLERLREDTKDDGDRFAGYAPVLKAVAARVLGESNPSALSAKIEQGQQPVTLETVVDAILRREQEKLGQLELSDPSLRQKLYHPDEQFSRIAARLYKKVPPPLPPMSPADAQTYSNALDSWVPEHPFLDGGSGTSSAVFQAAIAAWSMKQPDFAAAALQEELSRGSAANPFLAEFYLGSDKTTDESISIEPEHIGAIYASVRARLSLGDAASLSVDAFEDENGQEQISADVEVGVYRHDTDVYSTMRLTSHQAGTLRLGSYVEDVEVTAPHLEVELGGGPETLLVAPVSIQASRINLSTTRLFIEAAPGRKDSGVYLEAEEAGQSELALMPTIHGDASLAVSWPGSRVHPWTNFSTTPEVPDDPRIEEALRRFRKFIISFRSHSKGSLKRYRHKLEHERMTKGLGQAVLSHMVHTGVLSLDGDFYTLHPAQLAEQAGTSYLDAMARSFGTKAIAYLTPTLG